MAATATDTDVVPSTPSAPTRRSKTRRFWNWKLIGLEFFMAAAGIYGFLTFGARSPRIAWLGIGVLGVWLLSREFRGVAINSERISLPTGRPRQFPILSLGPRQWLKPASLRELTVMRAWYGFEVVEIQGGFGSELLVFSDPRPAPTVHEHNRRDLSRRRTVPHRDAPEAMIVQRLGGGR